MQKASPGIEPGTFQLLEWSLRPLSYMGWCWKSNWNFLPFLLLKIILKNIYLFCFSGSENVSFLWFIYQDHCRLMFISLLQSKSISAYKLLQQKLFSWKLKYLQWLPFMPTFLLWLRTLVLCTQGSRTQESILFLCRIEIILLPTFRFIASQFIAAIGTGHWNW